MKTLKNICALLLLAGLIGLSGCKSGAESNDAKGGEGKVSDGGEQAKGSDRLDFDPSGDEEDDKEKSSGNGGSRSTVVKFGKGKTSRTYENAVIRGETHTYILGAAKGQNMSVNISSTEDNAVFRVQTPAGQYFGNTSEEEGTKRFNQTLPADGNYKITVSPTRGNATFKISFAVKGGAKAEGPTKPGGKTTVVRFRKGGTSATYENSVVRGDRDTYILGASAGQLMSVEISALENNAVFDIKAPNGRTLASEVRDWSGQLPVNGKYRITVGGTRGNATYKVRFAVR